jgi:hypothetical protein
LIISFELHLKSHGADITIDGRSLKKIGWAVDPNSDRISELFCANFIRIRILFWYFSYEYFNKIRLKALKIFHMEFSKKKITFWMRFKFYKEYLAKASWHEAIKFSLNFGIGKNLVWFAPSLTDWFLCGKNLVMKTSGINVFVR